MIEVPTSPLQTDAIADAAKLRGMSPGDYVRDCALTYAATHLHRSLAEWLDLEVAQLSDGARCGSKVTLKGANGDTELACERMRGHQHDAVAALDVHAHRDPQHGWNTWQ